MFSSFVNSIYILFYTNRLLFARYFVKYTIMLLCLIFICRHPFILGNFNIHK